MHATEDWLFTTVHIQISISSNLFTLFSSVGRCIPILALGVLSPMGKYSPSPDKNIPVENTPPQKKRRKNTPLKIIPAENTPPPEKYTPLKIPPPPKKKKNCLRGKYSSNKQPPPPPRKILPTGNKTLQISEFDLSFVFLFSVGGRILVLVYYIPLTQVYSA